MYALRRVTAIRHGESDFNVAERGLHNCPQWGELKERFDAEFADASFEDRVLADRWPADDLCLLGREVRQRTSHVIIPPTDAHTQLTEVGKWQALHTGMHMDELLALDPPDVVLVSDYLRAIWTWQLVRQGSSLLQRVPFALEKGIRERDYGRQQQYLNWRLAFLDTPQQAVHWKRTDMYSFQPIGGNTIPDVRASVRSALGGRRYEGLHVMLVSHVQTILSVMAELLQWDPEEVVRRSETDRISNCGVAVCERDVASGQMMERVYNRVLYPAYIDLAA